MGDSLTGNGNGSGLLGKLLLPNFVDAGANSSFQPGALRFGGDQGSEAATEVRDNRSAIKRQFRINSSRNHQGAPTQRHSSRFSDDATSTDSSAISATHHPSHLGETEHRYGGFFPTTKPQLSPRPSSPPSLPRQQPMMVASAISVAGTSVVPETGAFDFDMKKPATTESAHEKENQKRIYYWENEVTTVPSQKGNLSLNAANLQLMGRERRRQTPTSSPTSDTSSRQSPRPNRNTSLLKDEDCSSDVMSTASEMGTVIEMGNNAARMAEIDAMAALIEASPNVDTLTPRSESFPLAPSRTPLCRTVEEAVASLSLPELDSAPNQPIVLAPHTKANPGSARSSFQHEQRNQPAPAASNPTPAEMLTSALRRIGTGLNKSKASLSAPPTPRTPGVPPPPRVEDLLKSSLSSYHQDSRGNFYSDLPLSLALRSPGSSARLSLRRLSQQRDEEARPDLAPRFSPTRQSKVLQTSSSFDSAFGINYRTKTVKTLPSSIPTLSSREVPEPLKLNPLSPFHLAQKCFSYDSTLDEPFETESVSSSHIFNLESSYPMHRQHPYQRPRKLKESMSWDVGGTSGAFRAQPHRSYRIGALKPTTTQMEHNAQRLRIYSDFSPRRAESNLEGNRESPDKMKQSHLNRNSVLKLRTPDRYMVDVEREDALDILACLVERGVSVWNEEPTNLPTNDSTDSAGQAIETVIDDILEELRKTSPDADDSITDSTSKKVMALEALLKSHAYATEMKRAALSASTWLRSIGRGIPVSDQRKSSLAINKEASEVGQASGEDASSDKLSDANMSFSAATSDAKMELLTLKARLHRTENELREKTIMNEKLDEELCKCRAEIGRLRTAQRNDLNISQTHSIIDDEVEDSVTESTAATCPAIKDEVINAGPTTEAGGGDPNENKLFDESFQGNNSLFQDASMHEQTDVSESSNSLSIQVLKTALEQANDTIRFLHEKLQKEVSEHERNEPPTIDIPGIGTTEQKPIETQGSQTKESSETSDEHRTINVRMLDGENFVTEWDELSSPLPPPPDHGLRSPIVNAVLTQWTEDPNLHHSLLAWMERVMTGDNLENTVPPLTISSLDHQVRDGFIMHVLPLLLRRADIHVSVQMRVHRRTTYDLAVSVNQKRVAGEGRFNESRSPSLLDQHSNEDWGAKVEKGPFADNGTRHSSAMALENVFSRNSQAEDMEYSHFGIPNAASEDMDDHQQSTFIGALGGAIGGLLSRGKYVQSPSRMHNGHSMPGFQAPQARGPHEVAPLSALGNRMAELDYQPYHRVVSAPPGRIGVTFVDYRGHAMVADMAPDSPLSSWVFPSDILIAVDEIPVSGMRVRDIIKILTNRKDRQRALRVISSHAMNEFTLNQSAVGDEPP